jgi:hypothetical protein
MAFGPCEGRLSVYESKRKVTPKRPIEFVYVPRVWPALAVSSGIALVLWPLSGAVGQPKASGIFAAAVFSAGIVALVLCLRRRVGVIPLALPSPQARIWLIRIGLGLCWGAALFAALALGYRD